jgi:hypothetical protein
VDRFGLEPLGGAEFKRVGIAKQVDRAHLGAHLFGDQAGDSVKPGLSATLFGHDRAQTSEHLAAVGLYCAHRR